MGNCQAIDSATLVIQHPSGKVDKLYWPVSAHEIMKTNPGHYVALLISTSTACSTKDPNQINSQNHPRNSSVRLTRIKLLRPADTLVLGQVYRLITTQEVMKGLWAKKQAKMNKNRLESTAKPDRKSELEENKIAKQERANIPRTTRSTNSGTTRSSRTWQPALKSISEAAT